MSYQYPQGQHPGQAPPLPPRPPYQDQYGQYQNTQNGGHAGQYEQPEQHYGSAPQYGVYQPGGGPVQQPQYEQGYQSPRTMSFSYGQQPYSPQMPTSQSAYNPAQYALQQPVQQYNPAAYATPLQMPYPTSYNQAAYPEPPVHRGTEPIPDLYGYSPGRYNQSQYSSPQPGSYGQFSPAPAQQQLSPQTQYPPPQQASHAVPYHHQQAHSAPSNIAGFDPHGQSTLSPQAYQQDSPYSPPGHVGRISSMSVPQRHPSDAGSISSALPGLPGDETFLPSPPNYQLPHTNRPSYDPYADRQSPSPLHPNSSHTSLPSPPAPTPPTHGPQRTNTHGRHPAGRPLPGPPPESESGSDYYHSTNNPSAHLATHLEETVSTDVLFAEVEDAAHNLGRDPSMGRSPSRSVSQAPFQPIAPLFSPNSPHNGGRNVNGHLSPNSQQSSYSDESDAEAAGGLEAMRLAEQEDAADDVRRQSGGSQVRLGGYGSQRNSLRHNRSQTAGHDSDSDEYGGMDLGLYGGGYEAQMSYGGAPNQLVAGGDVNGEAPYSQSQPVSNASSTRKSQASSNPNFDYAMDSIHPFPPFSAARVDAVGTGGLAEPSADGRRQSYDEGDEYTLMDSASGPTGDTLVGGEYPRGEPPDLSYYPPTAAYRPLPPPPSSNGDNLTPLIDTDWRGMPGASPYPLAPDGYTGMNAAGVWVPRSSSLLSHSNTPQIVQPIRSKTDAEERRLRAQQYRGSVYSPIVATPASANTMAIDLPSLPTKRFVPSKLGAPDFNKCEVPWALSSIVQWLRDITPPEMLTELKENAVKEALVALFTNKVPTMNIADAEVLSNRVVQDMYEAGTLVMTEEWVKLGTGYMSGVIFQLTGTGCYSPTLHDHVVLGRCYSHHCQRTLKKVNLQAVQTQTRASEDWATYYKLTKEMVEGKAKKEIERQNILHEIVQSEDRYMDHLNVLRTLYRDPLASAEPSIVSPKRREKFLKDVFGKVDAVKKANEDHLLPQLKYRQEEQGPWIVGFSDIFRQWIRKAKTAYIEYAGAFPGATYLMRQEMDRNIEFRTFLDQVRLHKLSNKLGWDTFLKAPITKLQQYSLLLGTALRNMPLQSLERDNLEIAVREVKEVTLECDARVAEMQRKVDLGDLGSKLVLRPGMKDQVELNLNHLGRELVFRGDLQRTGSNRFTWLDCHVLLFDHYMVLAKTIVQRDTAGGKIEKYDVSRLPIPMDLLVLESSSEDAVVKGSHLKGITTVTTVTAPRGGIPLPGEGKLGRTASSQPAISGPGSLQHTNTSLSLQTVNTNSSAGGRGMVNATIFDGPSKDSEKIMYPFKVKHLGRETYTLFAPSAQNRNDWCNKILEAKTKHAAALFAQNAEPFRLRVMADSAFTYDQFASSGGKGIVIQGTPVDRAIKEVEHKFRDTGRPGPICRARVNCATSFTTPYPGNQRMVTVGTNYGVFVSEIDNPRGWTKAILHNRVTQIAVLEEFNLFLLISEKTLIAYHLDAVCPPDHTSGTNSNNDSARKAPQKLSGSKDVGFFVTGRMKDRTLVFYKKRESLSSTFKVLEPIFQKSTEKKRGVFKRGTTEFFREFDEFYIPAECTGINLFQSSLAVSTAKGFEVLTLDKKQPFSVPDLRQSHTANIAQHIKDQKALCMLRLSDQEFLLVYERCAVYVNKHGEVSRSVIMEFVGIAQSAALYGAYLVLFDNDFVEIRNAQNGRLKQIIAGRDIKCLDDGGSWSAVNGGPGAVNGPDVVGGRTVKVVMQHPELERTQIVVELLLNEGIKD